MKRMDEKIGSCMLCRLCETRTKAVPGSGNIENPSVVFIGEGPGKNEDLQGKPFVGRGGKLLDELLQVAGLERNQVYITNIVKCRPPKNRKPKPDEIVICTSNYLEKQLDILKPKIICTLGATALRVLHRREENGAESWQTCTLAKIGNSCVSDLPPCFGFSKSLPEDLARR